MVRVAVAGGTGAIGRTFVEVLSKSHHVIVLSRSARQSTSPNIEYTQVNYSDITATASLLTSLNVSAVVSAIAIEDAASAQSQQNLTQAAAQSTSVKRFIPSEYGHVFTPENITISPLFQLWQDNIDVLAKTSLEWVRIRNGFFMDYYGMPHVKTLLKPFFWGVSIKDCRAAIPGDGEQVLSMTYTYDLAAFISKLLDEEEAWPEIVNISGQDFTFNQLVRWAEEVRGKKFEVKYDSVDTLQRLDATVLPEVTSAYPPEIFKHLSSLFGQLAARGDFHLPMERLNERYPDIKVMTMEELIQKAWRK